MLGEWEVLGANERGGMAQVEGMWERPPEGTQMRGFSSKLPCELQTVFFFKN